MKTITQIRSALLLLLIILSTALLAFAASLFHGATGQAKSNDSPAGPTPLSGPSGKFGPVVETVLAAPGSDKPARILDLETGRVLVQPSLEHFNSQADAIMAWIRSNGLDISCNVWSNGAACVTYDMTVVAVDGKCWQEPTEAKLLDNSALAPRRHSPRRLLVLGPNRPDTYIFRTGEGNVGMLRIDGLSDDGGGVKIRYKLINPPASLTVARSL